MYDNLVLIVAIAGAGAILVGIPLGAKLQDDVWSKSWERRCEEGYTWKTVDYVFTCRAEKRP
jgi:hypothetical protein